ncbi:unnamed protein product [Boreogadus saida]
MVVGSGEEWVRPGPRPGSVYFSTPTSHIALSVSVYVSPLLGDGLTLSLRAEATSLGEIISQSPSLGDDGGQTAILRPFWTSESWCNDRDRPGRDRGQPEPRFSATTWQHTTETPAHSVRVKAQPENFLNVDPFERTMQQRPGLQEQSLFS